MLTLSTIIASLGEQPKQYSRVETCSRPDSHLYTAGACRVCWQKSAANDSLFHLFAAQENNSFMRFTRYFDLMRYGCSVFGCVAKDAWPPATSNQMKSSVTWRLSKTPIQMRYKKETTLSHPTHTGCLNQDAQIGSNQKTMRTIGPYGLRLKCNSVLNQLVNHLTNKTQACEVPSDSPFGQRCEIAFETRKGREPGELDRPPFPGGSLHGFWPHTQKRINKRALLGFPQALRSTAYIFFGDIFANKCSHPPWMEIFRIARDLRWPHPAALAELSTEHYITFHG